MRDVLRRDVCWDTTGANYKSEKTDKHFPSFSQSCLSYQYRLTTHPIVTFWTAISIVLCVIVSLSTKIKKKNDYISKETFSLIKELSILRRSLFSMRSRPRKAILRSIFGIWNRQPWKCKWSCVFGFSSLNNVKLLSQSHYAWKVKYMECRIQAKNDKSAYFRKKLSTMM